MGRKSTSRYPGLRLRGSTYWIDIDNKQYGRVFESTGFREDQKALAVRKYHDRLAGVARTKVFGERARRQFRDAATRHLNEFKGSSAWQDAHWLGQIDPFIGDLWLDQVHDGTLSKYVTGRQAAGIKANSINRALEVVRKILNKAARKWRDEENGTTWLETAPLISMLPTTDERPPYPITWDEERKLLLPALPGHLERMALYDVNTGLRDEEVCALRWSWEQEVAGLGAKIFVLPGYVTSEAGEKARFTKNGKPRIVVHNRTAQEIIEAQRGQDAVFVFPYRGRRIGTMNNTGWQTARAAAAAKYAEVFQTPCPEGFRTLHVHDLRHTFGRRLRSAGVANETRADLLGHAGGDRDITTHYSSAEIGELLEAVKKIEGRSGETPTLALIRAA